MRAEQFLYVNYVLQYVNGHAVAGSIPGFSSPSDGTINRGPVSI